MRRATVAAGVTLAVIAAGACAQSVGGHPGAADGSRTTPVTPPPTTAAPATPSTSVSASARVTTAPPAAHPTATVPAAYVPLPVGGTTILGRYRVVAYYGGPNGPALGVLGSAPPDQIAAEIATRARQFARPGRPVLPAMELIATVAQGAPGTDGTYSKAIPRATVLNYLAAAHRHHMLLVLDFQPGLSTFLPQVQALDDVIADPSVSVALDPEWKMAPGQVPGTTVGSASAASVNAVIGHLAQLIAARHLPDKLLLVHQFRVAMLPDRGAITPARGVEVVFHADGFGTQAQKLATWQRLAFPGRPFGAGFKLFLRQDTVLMTPDQVLALRPAPDVITFQ